MEPWACRGPVTKTSSRYMCNVVLWNWSSMLLRRLFLCYASPFSTQYWSLGGLFSSTWADAIFQQNSPSYTFSAPFFPEGALQKCCSYRTHGTIFYIFSSCCASHFGYVFRLRMGQGRVFRPICAHTADYALRLASQTTNFFIYPQVEDWVIQHLLLTCGSPAQCATYCWNLF